MTNRTSRKQKYTLPETVDPADRICVAIPCPNERFHIAALMGALQDLGHAYNWQNDDAHTAIDVANVWRDIVDEVALQPNHSACGFDAPNMLCISGSFTDADYGWVAGSGAVCSPTYTPGTGWQSCYDSGGPQQVLNIERTLDNATYLRNYSLNWNVGSTATITFTAYYLGNQVFQDIYTSVAGGVGSHGADVNQQVDFIAVTIILSTSNATQYQYLTGWNLCYTGDFPLAQEGTNNFVHTFDFTVDDGGWVRDTAIFNNGTWVSGSGWQTSDVDPLPTGGNGWRSCVIHRSLPATRLTSMQITYDQTLGCMVNANYIHYDHMGSVLFGTLAPHADGSGQILSTTTAEDGVTELNIRYTVSFKDNGGGSSCTGVPLSGSGLITKVVVTGVGSDPF